MHNSYYLQITIGKDCHKQNSSCVTKQGQPNPKTIFHIVLKINESGIYIYKKTIVEIASHDISMTEI